jgi:hypothetical protein
MSRHTGNSRRFQDGQASSMQKVKVEVRGAAHALRNAWLQPACIYRDDIME